MATVWLSKADCESGALPRLCLRCGRPTTRFVRKDFSGKFAWVGPEVVRGDGNREKAFLLVPICDRHEWYREQRFLLLAAAGGLMLIAPCGLMWLWEGSGVVSVILLALGFLLATGGALGHLFLGPMKLEAIDGYREGVVMAGVSEEFARAYRSEDGSLVDRVVSERWNAPRPPRVDSDED